MQRLKALPRWFVWHLKLLKMVIRTDEVTYADVVNNQAAVPLLSAVHSALWLGQISIKLIHDSSEEDLD